MERLSVEVWQQIILRAMETSDWPIFTTRCPTYTFLGFTYLPNWLKRDGKPYLDYLAQRRRLRLVCRAWNEFVLFTRHRWLLLEDCSPMFKLDSTTTRAKGGVGPIEILSTEIRSREFVTPVLSWASHILKRPASQSPLRAYILHLNYPLEHNPLDLLVGTTTTTQDPECTNTNTNTTLLSLSIISSYLIISSSLSQISRTFTGLRSLFLINVKAAPQQTLALAHLEVLYVECPYQEWGEVQQSIETWDMPSLRHVGLGKFTTPLPDVLDRCLGRYAHQIESLIVSARDSDIRPCLDLPSGFWTQFTALRLLGFNFGTLKRKGWSGWSVVPPPTHPCRYLVGNCYYSVGRQLDVIRPRWTWHDGVRLVAGSKRSGSYYLVKNMQDSWSIENMEEIHGILPEPESV